MTCPASPPSCCRGLGGDLLQVAASSVSVAVLDAGAGAWRGWPGRCRGASGRWPVPMLSRSWPGGGSGWMSAAAVRRASRGGGVGRVAGLVQTVPQVGPVGVHDQRLPVVVFEAGQELGHQPGRAGEPGQGGGGPGGQGVQELGGVQGGGAVAEERVQHLAACGGFGGVELGGEPGRVRPWRRRRRVPSAWGGPAPRAAPGGPGPGRPPPQPHRRRVPGRRRRAAGRAARAVRGPAPPTRPGPARAPAAPAPICRARRAGCGWSGSPETPRRWPVSAAISGSHRGSRQAPAAVSRVSRLSSTSKIPASSSSRRSRGTNGPATRSW